MSTQTDLLKQHATTIKNEVADGANTANRVGGAILEAANILKTQEATLASQQTAIGQKATQADLDAEIARAKGVEESIKAYTDKASKYEFEKASLSQGLFVRGSLNTVGGLDLTKTHAISTKEKINFEYKTKVVIDPDYRMIVFSFESGTGVNVTPYPYATEFVFEPNIDYTFAVQKKNVQTTDIADVELYWSKMSISGKISEALEKEVTFSHESIGGLQNLLAQMMKPSSYTDVELTIEANRIINGTTGLINVLSNMPAYVVGTAAVEGGKIYRVVGSNYIGNGLFAFYDSDDKVITFQKPKVNEQREEILIFAPYNAVKIAVAGQTNKTMPSLGTPDNYSDNKKWAGKKWAAVGDSLTAVNSRTTMHYHDYIAEETGIEVVNMGASGTGHKQTYNGVGAFYTRMADVPTDADVITIFGSFNDNSFFNNIGNVDDTGTETLAGCVNTCLDNLFAHFPLANVGLVSPTPWQYFYPSVAKADAYVEMLKNICERRGIPFLDLYHNSGLRPWNAEYRTLCYSKDDGGGVHPDETGHKLFAPRFKAFLETLLF